MLKWFSFFFSPWNWSIGLFVSRLIWSIFFLVFCLILMHAMVTSYFSCKLIFRPNIKLYFGREKKTAKRKSKFSHFFLLLFLRVWFSSRGFHIWWNIRNAYYNECMSSASINICSFEGIKNDEKQKSKKENLRRIGESLENKVLPICCCCFFVQSKPLNICVN